LFSGYIEHTVEECTTSLIPTMVWERDLWYGGGVGTWMFLQMSVCTCIAPKWHGGMV